MSDYLDARATFADRGRRDADPARPGAPRALPLRPVDRVAVHRARRSSFSSRSTSSRCSGRSISPSPTTGPTARTPRSRCRHCALRAHPDRRRHLALHAGDGAFRLLDDRCIETVLGFALAYLIDRNFRGHAFWTTVILIPMMLSPAVVGNFWKFLYQPQIGLFNYAVSFFTGVDPTVVPDARRGRARALGDRPRRRLDVDALRDADLPRRAPLHPRLHLRGGRSRPRLRVAAVLVDHGADGAALHHARGAVPRHRELQDVRHGQPARPAAVRARPPRPPRSP